MEDLRTKRKEWKKLSLVKGRKVRHEGVWEGKVDGRGNI